MDGKLYRSEDNKMICGVCGGLAEYFHIDATLVRIVWAAVTLFSAGAGLILYIVAGVLMPSDQEM